jgi:fermentation-respiration switch protein FrsA (DUF1100 family)
MSQDEMLRFDKNELEQHADEYCGREARLSNELVDYLRTAAYFAPVASAHRVRRLMNDADTMARYFSAMKEALYEAGEQVEATSLAVLERLEEATDELNRLLQ